MAVTYLFWIIFLHVASIASSIQSQHNRHVQLSDSQDNHAAPCIQGWAAPRIFLLGHQKTGTSTLANRLFMAGASPCKHDDDFNPMKEVHVFDEVCGYQKEDDRWNTSYLEGTVNGGGCPTDPEKMRITFAEVYSHLNNNQKETNDFHPARCGDERNGDLFDMTPSYARIRGLPSLLKSLYASDAQRLSFIVVLREPLARLQSIFHQTHGKNKHYGVKTPFEFDTLPAYLAMIREELPDYDSLDNEAVANSYRYDLLYRSLYGITLSEWVNAFDYQQMMVMPMKWALSDGVRFLETVSRHSQVSFSKLEKGGTADVPRESSTIHGTLEEDIGVQMIEEMHKKYFQPDLQRLAPLLSQVKVAGWGGPDSGMKADEFLKQNW